MKLAVLGYGTVGKSVAEIIKSLDSIELASVLVRKGKETESYMTSSIDDITGNNNIETVIECIGGTTDAYSYVRKCIECRKNVVTANKALVAEYGIELNKLAVKNNVSFLFSAACGGGIPVLSNVLVSKQTDTIYSCRGIINGTTNYILSNLKSGKFDSYSMALKKAQELGYAEADPASDVSGLDTLRKVKLLSAVAFDVLPSEGLNCEGIENIDLNTMRDATVKLVGFCGRNKDNSVYSFVEPIICKRASSLAEVNSNNNQIEYTGKNCGTIILSGQGAGGLPTASNIMRDVTQVQNGQKSMLSESCVNQKADNSLVYHRYIVCTEEKTYRTEKTSVSEMHSKIKEMRKNGSRVFFASIEE